MRPDANRIGLRAIRAILEAAAPFDLTVGGKPVHVEVTTPSGTEPWPVEMPGISERDEGAWPGSVDLTCTWPGGSCAFRLKCRVWSSQRTGRLVSLRIREGARGPAVVWTTIPRPGEELVDGETTKLLAWTASYKRKREDAPDLNQRLGRAMRELVRESKLSIASSSSVEIGEISIPGGEVRPSARTAFERFVHIALLKLEFVGYSDRAKPTGTPLVDLGRWGIDPALLGGAATEAPDDEIGEDDEDASQRCRRYWAGGFGEAKYRDEYLKGSYWQFGWPRDSPDRTAKQLWSRFDKMQIGDYFALKGLGGEHQLIVYAIGEVTAIDPENRRVQFRPLDRKLYKGPAPKGAKASNWFDTLVAIERPDIIELLFQEKAPTALAPPPPAASIDVPLNLILYGPPGTGKTFTLQRTLAPKFTSRSHARTAAESLTDLALTLKWYEAIAVALQSLGGRGRVDALVKHPLLLSKHAAQSVPTGLRQIIWGNLGHHAVERSTTVRMKRRLGEALFDKEADGTWYLAEQFPDELSAALEALSTPEGGAEVVKHHEFVTFHQAYGYEDFIEGIRPRIDDDDEGELGYELRDGVFMKAVRAAVRLAGYEGTVHELCGCIRFASHDMAC